MIHKQILGHITQCQICGDKDFVTILSFGHHAPVHAHLTKEGILKPEVSYPLNFCRCNKCGLLQLDYIVDPKVVFSSTYPYYTGMTKMLVRNFLSLRDVLVDKYKLTQNDLVIDIGSNDGTLLQGFKEKGIQVLGIEPTDVAKVAIKNGIPTMQEFFNEEIVSKIAEKYGHAKIITGANVFAHIPDPISLARAIRELLSDDGIFVSESQYLLDTVEKGSFDMIYDEHLRYYSLKPMIELFKRSGMHIIHAERIDAAGGSIRVYASKAKYPVSDSVDNLIAKEERAGLYNIDTFKKFSKRAYEVKHDLMSLVLKCKEGGNRIVGIGAPGRSNTLLQFINIDNYFIDYACERKGSPKIGLLTPGTHIPIVDEEILFREQPEYGLLLSWHIGDELMKKLRDLGYKGKFIVPLPKPRIIDDI